MEILSLGEKIKRRRKELNMTLKDLAKDRITPGQISLVESGRSNPSMDLLEYLSNSLNTTVEYLMESEESQAEKISRYYSQVAESYILSEDYSKGEEYIQEALKYAEKYDLEYRKAKILYLRGLTNILKGELTAAQQFFLSANVIFIKNDNYDEIIQTFLNLGKITLELKAYNSASSYLRQAEKVYTDNNIGNDYVLGKIYYYISRTYFAVEDSENAKEYAYLAKSKFEQIYDKKEYAKTLLHISEDYSRKGDLANAIKFSDKTLEIYEEINKINNLSSIENNLGKMFYDFEKIEESFKHYKLAKQIVANNNDKLFVETSLNMCKNHIKLKNIIKCEALLKEVYPRISDDNYEGIIEYNLIRYRIHTIKEEYDSAEMILIQTYKLAKDRGLYKRAGELAIMLGKYFMDKKYMDKASEFLDEAVSLFKQEGILQN
ncbi:MAG: helix-turn-helix transcriptional regulator [Clostridium sp.]|jgi:transcriptional regulator with XRE-family HTH domain|nr:helix-turn-helix transcriptional regulator [Clostridium sp.]